MNWQRGLIRLSLVLTVLWGIACVYYALVESMEVVNRFYSPSERLSNPNMSVIRSEMRQGYLIASGFWWAAGAAIWWATLYTGFWIARGFRR